MNLDKDASESMKDTKKPVKHNNVVHEAQKKESMGKKGNDLYEFSKNLLSEA